jgi:hypothetical protein
MRGHAAPYNHYSDMPDPDPGTAFKQPTPFPEAAWI